MWYSQDDNVYRIIRITGSQDNILGVSFAEDMNFDSKIEVIEWDGPNYNRRTTPTSKEEVLEQVLSGLESVNKSLGTNYKLSKIYFVPWDSASYSVYSLLICKLIRHYHAGKSFKKIDRKKSELN